MRMDMAHAHVFVVHVQDGGSEDELGNMRMSYMRLRGVLSSVCSHSLTHTQDDGSEDDLSYIRLFDYGRKVTPEADMFGRMPCEGGCNIRVAAILGASASVPTLGSH